MDISHHTAITKPAVAAPFHPMGYQQKGLVKNIQAIPDTFVDQFANNNKRQQTDPMVQSHDNPPVQGFEVHMPSRMVLLQYGHQTFPTGVHPRMLEVPAHLDIQHFNVAADYSLHTEYSSKARKLDSPLLDGLNAIKRSHRKGVPVLWVSKEWAGEFAEFTIRLVAANHPPKVIEIHPSFMDGTMSVEAFLDIYAVFESKILEHFPDCEILIENRSGTKHPKPFMVSDADSILRLGMALEARSLRLGIALDLAQMFTREFGSKQLVGSDGVELVRRLIPIRDQIHSLHLWGRGKGGGAHSGDLDGLFNPTTGAKQECLGVLRDMFVGGRPRYLVLEVNNKTGELTSILEDLFRAGFVIEPVV